jgi:hypothetical protein
MRKERQRVWEGEGGRENGGGSGKRREERGERRERSSESARKYSVESRYVPVGIGIVAIAKCQKE